MSSEWMGKGKCRDFEPDTFHPSGGGRNVYEPAKRICRSGCPVMNECLSYALAHMSDEGDDPATRAIGRHGVWGATDPHERKRMHRLIGRAA